jgi:glycosyltransferase involved in cell wall biosynthesis
VKYKIKYPKISIVIPNYNRALDLRRCLDSLLHQSFKDFEVLVCDDGSTDNSCAIAAEYSDRLDIFFQTDDNFGGPARPRNRGIRLARAPYIAFLDSDDWWLPDKLLHSYIALEDGADVVFHDLFIVRTSDQRGGSKKIKSTDVQSPVFESLLCDGVSIPNSSVVTRKDLLEKIEGVSEERDLISVEDYDTWIRLACITEKFIRLPICLGYYWVGGGNISAASPRQQILVKALYARHLERLPLSRRAQAEGFLCYRIARIAQQHGDHATAMRNYKKALLIQIPVSYRIKAIYFYLQSMLAIKKCQSV